MKTIQKIIWYTLLILIALACIFQCGKLVWKIILPVFIAFIAYISYELDNALPMPEDDDESINDK